MEKVKWVNEKVVLASNNRGKLEEFKQLFDGRGIDIIPQAELAIADAEETGLSFVENAIIKARHASRLSGLPALADDSGLEVDHLKGAPGIYSARFSGENATDHENNRKLLSLMEGVPWKARKACFQCLLVFMRHPEDPTPLICQGTWQGVIALEPSGSNGFGYDPLFYVADRGCASAELDKDSKNLLSHRARAMRQLLEKF